MVQAKYNPNMGDQNTQKPTVLGSDAGPPKGKPLPGQVPTHQMATKAGGTIPGLAQDQAVQQQQAASATGGAGSGDARSSALAQLAAGAYTGSARNYAMAMYGITDADIRAYQQQAQQQTMTQQAMSGSAPPANPGQALDMQFYENQDAQLQQQEIWQEQQDLYGLAGEEASAAHTASQQQNQAIMQQGIAAQQAEQEAVRQRNEEMMQQSQATYSWIMGLARRGGQGSMWDALSPLGGQVANTWQQGRWDPQQYGQYYQNMLTTPDPTSQYTAAAAGAMGNYQVNPMDYSAWLDPQAHATSWYIPPITPSTTTIPTASTGTTQQDDQSIYEQFILGYIEGLYGVGA